MPHRWQFACATAILVLAAPLSGQIATPASAPGDPSSLLTALQAVVQRSDVEGFLRLVAPEANTQQALAFARGLFGSGPATRVAVVQRDRLPLRTQTSGAEGLRLAVDIFIERGTRASIVTTQIDVVPPSSQPGVSGSFTPAWQILAAQPLSTIDGLERLSVDPATQLRATGLVVRGEDVEFRLPEGRVFVVRSGESVTGAVLLGDGEMHFQPSSLVERSQVRIFSGADALDARFDAVYFRLSPSDASALLPVASLAPEPVDRRLLERAIEVFSAESDKSYVINVGDLSPDRWWVQPLAGDVVAEVRTKKYGALTYARSWNEHEDIMVFDRQRRRHIAVYASPEKLAARGRFYDDSDGQSYQVLHYDVDAAVVPDRTWIQGSTRLRIKTVEPDLARLTLRLADALKVESVSTDRTGRLLGLRVRGQNSLLVTLPKPVPSGTVLDVLVSYKGRLSPEARDRDGRAPMAAGPNDTDDSAPMPLEASFLYSNRADWYAHAPDEGYATARVTLHVPVEYSCVATGELLNGAPIVSGVVGGTGAAAAQRIYQFDASRPVKYLSFVVSRFTHLDAGTPAAPRPDVAEKSTPDGDPLHVSAEVTSRFKSGGQNLIAQATDMARVYTAIAGGRPYQSLSLALVEDDLPGGHSPAYFTVLNQVGRAGRVRLNWSADPAAFSGFPEYFLAHEVAHQWWGQAVGTKNYHEQWISEGFAQYFAALYAERTHGINAYRSIIRQLRKSTMDASADGPVYLGSRLGQLQGDSRVFRALVYNKGALVLHMLRLILGDEAFFRGLRRFYADFQFRKAGTDDVRKAFETEGGRSLDRFFEGWVYGEKLPTLAITTRIEPSDQGSAVTIRAEQGAVLFDVPVTVAIELADGSTRTFIMQLDDRVTERRLQIGQPVRRASVVDSELAATIRVG